MGVRDDERWRDQHPGLGAALETMTSAGTPLLAGFCVTMIGVVAQAPDKFWWASLTMLLLTVAAIGFVISIHCYYWARVHLIESGGGLARGLRPTTTVLDPVRERFAHLAWARRLHVFFQAGVLALFVGLATAVWPNSAEQDPWPRIAAVACCAAMVLLVLFWTLGFFLLRLVGAAEQGNRAARVVLWWFRPGERQYLRYRADEQDRREAAERDVGQPRGAVPDEPPTRPVSTSAADTVSGEIDPAWAPQPQETGSARS